MNRAFDVCIVGSGMGSLTTACLLAKEGLRVGVLEQNYLPGGCTSSYWRKGFVFESGATTLVGLDKNMPLWYLLEQTGIQLNARRLELPMQVWLKNGKEINRYQSLDRWIEEVEKVFGVKNQRAFWQFCYKISQFVWETSLKQTAFPPSKPIDFLKAVQNVDLQQISNAGYALMSMEALLKKFDLFENEDFKNFVNEQLLITAQNYLSEVNVLFGTTALCYTNFGNYYVDGGLINLVNPLVSYLEANNSTVFLRTAVEKVFPQRKGYELVSKKHGSFTCSYLVSGIPINNTLELFEGKTRKVFAKSLMHSKQLNSAFQMGIGFKSETQSKCIHHQIHLKEPLPEIGSKSIFVSLSHPDDNGRADEAGCQVASVSTHVHDPENNVIHHKEKLEDTIIHELEQLGFLERKNIVYKHSSTPKGWQKWTQRKWGFVGGYPQYLSIKPWKMLDARLDGKGAYVCGDTVYPGQGIPGTVLSGIIAYKKLKSDHF